jgi:hypothetical protein
MLSAWCCKGQSLSMEKQLTHLTHAHFLKTKVFSGTLFVVHAISVRAVVD